MLLQIYIQFKCVILKLLLYLQFETICVLSKRIGSNRNFSYLISLIYIFRKEKRTSKIKFFIIEKS